jgi:hypothetical protein
MYEDRRRCKIPAVKLLLLPLLLSLCSFAQESKTILLSVHAENEGPNGLWVQSGKDLTAPELAKLQELLDASFSTDKGVQLVETEDKRDHAEIVVSVTKVPRGKGAWYFAASSVIGLAKPKVDEFLSHNVVVCDDIPALAKAIGFSFASIRLRLALGMMDQN